IEPSAEDPQPIPIDRLSLRIARPPFRLLGLQDPVGRLLPRLGPRNQTKDRGQNHDRRSHVASLEGKRLGLSGTSSLSRTGGEPRAWTQPNARYNATPLT